HGPDDRVPQRLRATLHRRPRVRRSFAAQVRPVRRRQYARHEAGDVVCRSGSTRSARRHRSAAVRALPRRAARRRAVRRLLPSGGHRGAARLGPGQLVTFYPAVLNLRGRRGVVIGGGAWAEAEREGVLLNAVDDLDHCSFIAPAIHREGDITVAVSTSGKSPALAARLRQRVARLIGPADARLCALLGELRPEVAARVPDTHARTTLWYRILDSDVIEFVRRGDDDGARRRINELVEQPPEFPRLKPGPGTTLPLRAVPHRAHSSEWGHSKPGVVYLVGAGPGDPGLITAKGLEILRSADVVVYDRLVAPVLVTEAPPGAERVFVGKRPHSSEADLAQSEINALLVERARRGLTVVRLKGGDPFVFGRGAEECEA